MAYFRKNKTRKIIWDHYYWPKMVIDIDRYIWNYNNYCRFTIPQDKTLRLLKPLLILERPWQHILINFYILFIDRNGYNIAMILVDCFSKCLFLIFYYKNINTKEVAWLYIYYIYWIYRLLNTIISNYGLQFILVF